MDFLKLRCHKANVDVLQNKLSNVLGVKIYSSLQKIKVTNLNNFVARIFKIS